MNTAKLNENGFAIEAGTIRVYHIEPMTGEFIRESDEFINEGVGVPAHSYIDTPLLLKTGFAVCRSESGWKYVEDHRGETVYSIQTQNVIEITELGPLPVDVTTLQPETPFDRWDGERWITDEAAKNQADVEAAVWQKRDLEQKATAAIETLNDAIDLGLTEPGDEDMLKAWRAYRVKLSRVDVQAAPGVIWPDLPAN